MELLSFLLLSGGASTRMGGQDKGLLMLNDKPLIRHVLDSIEDFLNLLNLEKKIPVHIVLHDHIQQEDYQHAVPELREEQFIIDEVIWKKVFSDIPQPSQESIFGLWSGMTELKKKTKNVFVLPCDAPLVNAKVMSYLFNEFFLDIQKVGKSGRKKAISYIPRWENGVYELLFSILHIKSILPILEDNILKKKYSMQDIFQQIIAQPHDRPKSKYNIDVTTIEIEKDLVKYDEKLYNFLNIDSKENLEAVERIIQNSRESLEL
jgi:molybdopterin-guanine dinucleotide biosynthesis protein A